MKYKVFIDGQEGTTGLKLYEKLSVRPDIQLIKIASEERKDIGKRIACMRKANISFLCLPDQGSLEIMEAVEKTGEKFRILDTSTAFRTDARWIYGMPELCDGHKKKIEEADRVAVPGCHATGFITIVRPLIEEDMLNENSDIFCQSITGYSGGGKKMIAEYERTALCKGEDNMELLAPRQYALSQEHKHLPEMCKYGKLLNPPIFTPIVAGYYSGMLTTIPFGAGHFKKKINRVDLYEIFSKYYTNKPLIKVMEPNSAPVGGFLSANRLSGENSLELLIFGKTDAITVAASFDNLGKGASGAAIQCMNIMLGLSEETGLI